MSRNDPSARLLVLAKEPLPGRAKTRLTPDFSPVEAARLARAALEDTLDTVATAAARLTADGLPTETVLVLEGRSWPGLAPGWRIVPQRGNGLDERLSAAFADTSSSPDGVPGPAVLVGMDTPQLSADVLVQAVGTVTVEPDAGACLGLARDGGWWLLGFRHPDPQLLLGLPMSTPTTGAATAERLRGAGLVVAPLPVLHDVDTAADAELVAAQVLPSSRFARTYDDLTRLAS